MDVSGGAEGKDLELDSWVPLLMPALVLRNLHTRRPVPLEAKPGVVARNLDLLALALKVKLDVQANPLWA